MTELFDSQGTAFDPKIHHLLDGNPPKPELTSTGKFRAARAGGNPSEVIRRFEESLVTAPWDDASAPADDVATIETVYCPEVDFAATLASRLHAAEISSLGDGSYLVMQNGISVVVSDKVPLADALNGLRMAGMVFA